MLDWLTGASRSHETDDSVTGEGQSYLEEPPETPAHVFAVKAFKSAFFGTPARGKDDGVEKPQLHRDEKVGTHAAVKVDHEVSTMNPPPFQSAPKLPVRPALDVLPSPAKGILLTPGTGATRRKTVSFGQLADLAEVAVTVDSGKVEEPTATRSLSTGGSSRGLQRTRRREASLRRTLFEDRGISKPSVTSHEAPFAFPAEPQPIVVEECSAEKEMDDKGDITTDLKHPLSRSGQHWMNEYRRDHANSKKEMRKLLKYSQTTKSYARQRDAEALDLSDKLRKAELRVAEMETRVSGLASRLANKDQRDGGLPSNQAELLNELATQTARALRYKEKAEKCKLAVQEHGVATLNDVEASNSDGQHESAQFPKEAPPLQAEKDLQARGLQSLQEGVSNLRLVARSTERKAATLERENLALKHTLARVKQEMKAYEVRHKASQERRKRRDEKAEAQRQALKQELAQYNDGSIQKPESVPVMTSVQESTEEDRRPRTLKQHPVVDNLNLQYRGNVQGGPQSPGRTGKPPKFSGHEGQISPEKHTTSTNSKDVRSSLLQDSIDIWASSVPAREDAHPVQPQARVVSVGHTNNISKSTTMEPRLRTHEDGSATNDERTEAVKADEVPDTTMIGTGSAAVKEYYQPWLNEEVRLPELPLRTFRPGSGSNILSRLPSSSRTSSFSGRPPLPPDRVEAAKRRLEQRYAEKLRGGGDGDGKENRTP